MSGTIRQHILEIANGIKNPELRAQRIFYGEQSFAFIGRADKAFEIKSKISHHFQCDFRSINFCGSAHLGFSPNKDTDFRPGISDLDVAIVDTNLFQAVWQQLVGYSKSFTELNAFGSEPRASQKIANIHLMLARRGVLHLHDMPNGKAFNDDRIFLRNISRDYVDMFKQISVSFYMNEYAFAWKQNSSIEQILRV